MVHLTRDHTYLSECVSNRIYKWASAKKKKSKCHSREETQLLSSVEETSMQAVPHPQIINKNQQQRAH